MTTPREFLTRIDDAYLVYSKMGVSRFSVEWGKFSREMNLELRKFCEDHGIDPKLRIAYVDVFSYWTVVSELLQCYFEKPGLGDYVRKTQLKKQRAFLYKKIRGGTKSA